MNNAKAIPVRLIILLIVTLLAVTLGGLLVYKGYSNFFFPDNSGGVSEANGPAMIYYGLTLVIILMYFIMRQGYKGYEFAVFAILSLLYSLSLQKLTPLAQRHLYQYFIPLLVFFGGMWLILKYIFLNKTVRSTRLLLFSIASALDFSVAFYLLFFLLGMQTDASFWQSRFLSGLMLFIFMSFGMSVSDYILIRIELKGRDKVSVSNPPNKQDADDETN